METHEQDGIKINEDATTLKKLHDQALMMTSLSMKGLTTGDLKNQIDLSQTCVEGNSSQKRARIEGLSSSFEPNYELFMKRIAREMELDRQKRNKFEHDVYNEIKELNKKVDQMMQLLLPRQQAPPTLPELHPAQRKEQNVLFIYLHCLLLV